MQGKIDPITLEVMDHRLMSIAEEMEITLLKSSFSTIVKEGGDCSTAIFNAHGYTVAQAVAIPTHLGTLMESVPQILRKFPVSEMQEGDVYLANDPYTGGTHLNDITLVIPVTYQGEVIALTTSMVHHQDIGAMLPGCPTSSTSIYQEGLNLPPLKFYEKGKPVKVVHDIIRNNVRIPDTVIGDLRAQVAAGNVGKLRIQEFMGEFGKDMVLKGMSQLIDRAEFLTRQELRKIPGGRYTFVDYADNDGVDINQRIKIQVAVTIKGDEFIADFTGSNPQVRGPFNVPPSGTLAAACYVIKAITGGHTISSNAGAFRPIKLILPEGSIVNPRPPAAVAARASTILRITDVLLGAMVKAVPERLPAGDSHQLVVLYIGGHDPLTDRDYVWGDIAVGGTGGRPTKDGVDVILQGMVNGQNIPVEAIEAAYPQRVLKTSRICDSGGAGEYRGGLGMQRVLEATRGSVSITFRGERHYVRPWGLFGGLPGAKSRAFVLRKTGEVEGIPSKKDLVLQEDDQIHFYTSGGGGYGDPLKRKLSLVLQDVVENKVSVRGARDDYGVVIDENSMTLDVKKTENLREERRGSRGGITWTFDRGVDFGKE
jgi:N-methylhydantoinase B